MHLVQDHRRNNIMPVYRKSAGRKANKNFNKKKLNKNLVTNTTSAFGEKPKIVKTQFGTRVEFNKNRSNSINRNFKKPDKNCYGLSVSKCHTDSQCNWVWEKDLYMKSGHCENN